MPSFWSAEFIVIHNGIITNYKDLRKFLVSKSLSWSHLGVFLPDRRRDQLSVSPALQESKGYEFESETDTETIPKLVKYMYDNRESDDLSFATLVEQVIQQLVRTRSRSAAAREAISRVWLTCSFFHLPGGSFCLGLQKCPLPWRGRWHKVTWAVRLLSVTTDPTCWLIQILMYRRGSPLLMGVRSDHKLSTDHIPVLYRSCKLQSLFLV